MNLLHLMIVIAQIGMTTTVALGLFWAWVWMNCRIWVPRRGRVSGVSGYRSLAQ